MGAQTISFLKCIKVDVAILGSSGFDRHEGPSSNTFDDSQIKQVVIKNAQSSIVVADSRKATYSSFTQYANWKEIDHLITDDGISPELVQRLSEFTDVILV
ncbi:MAG: DeoR/GlpR transcriptional regulator [Lachnospiraceae bacterium]|nr:DeoR/GlpR transcriptional regulator [Lachnospiraceae bacterium]